MNTTDIDIKSFPVTIRQPVQWGEQDGFGHINNMYFIRWFESARIAYLRNCGVQLTAEGIGPILAAVNCNYRKQVKYPCSVIVGSRITAIGRSSMSMEHALWIETKDGQVGDLAANGNSTVVMFNYHQEKTVAVSNEIVAEIERLEGRRLKEAN